MADDLDKLRAKLRKIDDRIVDALADRRALVLEVSKVKAATGKEVRDDVRERSTLEHVADRGTKRGLDPHFLTRIFRELFDHSERVQHHHRRDSRPGKGGKLVVGYQGTEGAYSHLAATRHFGARGDEVRYWGFGSFGAMLGSLKDGELDFAMLPIENSIAGSINESYDLLAEMDLSLVGEEIQPIDHCLIGVDEVPVSHIRRVYSHPVALAQCRKFLATLEDCHIEAFPDTAMAVSKVKDDGDATQAAIASAEAARLNALPILRKDIADHPRNYTRMVIVARSPVAYDPSVPCKTSLIFSTAHEKGALARSINHFADRGLSLTKLESRPRPDTPWEYVFYADFEGNIENPAVRQALAELEPDTTFLKVLGSYPISSPLRE